jgi:Fe-S-cluster containining protein
MDEKLNIGETNYCSKCGNCCRLGGANYPELKRDDGSLVCKHFEEPNICTIYADRPWFCRSEGMAKILTTHGFTRDEEHYRELAERACKRIEVIPPDKLTNAEFTRIGIEELNRGK